MRKLILPAVLSLIFLVGCGETAEPEQAGELIQTSEKIAAKNFDIEEAKLVLSTEHSDTVISITDNFTGEVFSFDRDNINLRVDYSKTADTIYNNGGLWDTASFIEVVLFDGGELVYDHASLNGFVENFVEMWNSDAEPQLDAYIVLNEFTMYEIIPEYSGTALNADEVSEVLSVAITDGVAEVDLSSCVIDFTGISTADLQAELDFLNSFVSFSVSYYTGEYLDYKYLLDNEWVAFEDGTILIDEEKVRAFVIGLESTYDTAGKVRRFTRYDGAEINISGGTYGYILDRAGETAKLIDNILAGEPVSRSLVFKQQGTGEIVWVDGTVKDYKPGRYIEVSLSEQRMWFYVDGRCVLETEIVTGLTPGKATPKGTYTILEKKVDTRLRGPDWDVPVSYWMRVTWDGIGFHDATWRDSFGGNIYTYDGSRGCLNMPFDKAKELYSQLQLGDLVFIY